MNENNNFFQNKPILGMIHLASNDVKRAVKEVETYHRLGVDGVIVENYFKGTSIDEMRQVLNAIKDIPIIKGVNVLPNEFRKAFEIAREYNSDFIQLDYISGVYSSERQGLTRLDALSYFKLRRQNPQIKVLGGVWPKYYYSLNNSESTLEKNLTVGQERADAIVVTGDGTGMETPMDKIKKFRNYLGNFPLIIGAGLNLENLDESFKYCDGAIVGSFFKRDNNPSNNLDENHIAEFMDKVRTLR